ncbi:coniferyl aldehyde dehydrogenase [Speluncibacter jeojiensis]|uniref:Aldehyde dehydrogenase n=1 Tax=Speluncibacter jeojiensis TaxID=2710754 RepID=A0A9X4RGJ0_9ACTN|nr:coniferyl aldehyde dehydrogenase [Corynebacteriales bacterium D3-21]
MDATPAEHIADLLARQRAQRLAEGCGDAASRRVRIQRVIDLLVENHRTLVEAIDLDFGGRPRGYSIMNDVLGSLTSLKHARDHLETWMQPEPRPVFAPYDQLGATAQVRYQPKGSVGILGTWNAPLFTLLSPLAYALAAGNRAVLKPSEIVPRTAAILAELFAARVDPADVAVVTGGPELADAFTRQPFDHLVFTGSTAVGKSLMRNAAEHLVPVTLELGGKSPTVIGRSADLPQAAERTAMAKASNAGQLCVNADLVYVPRERLDEFAADLAKTYGELLPQVTGNPDAVSVVSAKHHARIRGYLDDAAAHGARIEVAPADESGRAEDRRLPLHIVIDPPADALIMREEIFGPAVVLLPYDTVEQVLADINARPNPLALYYFGTDAAEKQQVLDHTLSGGVTVNDLMMHPGLEDAPFGGVGASGMGHYHGREGFLEFSHARTVFEAPPSDLRREYGLVPPYGPDFESMMAAQITP